MSTRVFLLMMLLGVRYLVAQAIPATGYGGEDIYKTFISGEYYIILFIIIMHITTTTLLAPSAGTCYLLESCVGLGVFVDNKEICCNLYKWASYRHTGTLPCQSWLVPSLQCSCNYRMDLF